MHSFSKRVAVACAVFVVAGTFAFSTGSSAQEKAKTKQKTDRERIALLEQAAQTTKEQAKVIAALQQRVAQLEQRNTQIEQRAQQHQQDLANTHQRDVSNLSQQIIQLDQQVRTRRM